MRRPKTVEKSGFALDPRLAVAARAVIAAVDAVIDDLPDRPNRPSALAERLGVNKVLTSRVLKALREPDLVESLYGLPGSEPLQRLVRAAEKAGSGSSSARAALEAIESFESVVRTDFGTRERLSALLAAHRPMVRAKVELAAKQSIFRGISQIRGRFIEHYEVIILVRPNSDGRRVDYLTLTALKGIRGLTPDTVVNETIVAESPHAGLPMNVNGRPIRGVDDVILRELCSDPMPELALVANDACTQLRISSLGVSSKGSAELVLAMAQMGYGSVHATATDERAGFFLNVEEPMRSLWLTVAVHEGLGWEEPPLVRAFDAGARVSRPEDYRKRESSHLQVAIELDELGNDVAGWRSMRWPRLLEALRLATDRAGWSLDGYHAYRTRVEYPLYASEVGLTFKRPAPPLP
jgi:hypothetical protein